VHRIVGRVRPRPRTPIHKIAAHPLNPDGCARGTGNALNTPRPASIGAAGIGAGKIATLAGVGGAAIGSTLIPPGGTSGATGTPVAVLTPPSDPGSPGTPVITGGSPPIIVPPVPPVVVCTHATSPGCGSTSPHSPPVSVSEPATVLIFTMAIAALFLARGVSTRRTPTGSAAV